jgi:F-type H+-transporting ATPase subunit alpha
LLERAAKLDAKFGGGSLTALPIIETQAGDVTAYIPTNVISITDGQIYLEADLFNANIRPAVNVGLSVSRVGSAAQTKAMKKVAGRLKGDLSQYQSLEAFASFGGAELDKSTRDQLNRGKRIIEVLKQNVFSPMSLADQVTILYAVNNGYMDDVPEEKAKAYEVGFHKFMETSYSALMKTIATTKDLTPESEETLKKAIQLYKQGMVL